MSYYPRSVVVVDAKSIAGVTAFAGAEVTILTFTAPAHVPTYYREFNAVVEVDIAGNLTVELRLYRAAVLLHSYSELMSGATDHDLLPFHYIDAPRSNADTYTLRIIRTAGLVGGNARANSYGSMKGIL